MSPKHCKACWAARERHARQYPGSFTHGVQCNACRERDVAALLDSMRAKWRALKVEAVALGTSPRENSWRKELEKRMRTLEAHARELKGHK